MRSVALDNMFSNLDSYTGSARNYYIYHNALSDKWEWIKWDGNESFGSYSGGGGPGGGVNVLNLDPDYHDTDRPLLENIFASSGLYNEYLIEYCDILGDYFNSSYIDAIIDSHKALIQSSVYADNKKMHTNAEFDTNIDSDVTSGGGLGGGTIYGLKSFVTSRVNYLDGVVDCSLYTSVKDLEMENELQLFPNPASSSVDLKWETVQNVEISVINSVGMQQFHISISNNNSIKLDVSEWNIGIYYVRMIEESGKVSVKTLTVTK